jgi:hypothetical protein
MKESSCSRPENRQPTTLESDNTTDMRKQPKAVWHSPGFEVLKGSGTEANPGVGPDTGGGYANSHS